MIKSKKQMYIVVGAFLVVLMLFTTTYAFFNYTRTGVANTIKTGRISFTTGQTDTLNLANVFPITRVEAATDNTNSSELIVTITGDTTYSEGLEYLITVEDVHTETSTHKKVPIGIIVTPEKTGELGTSNANYFNTSNDGGRGGNTSYYKLLKGGTTGDTINDGDYILVGYIRPGVAEVNGTIGIRAFIDKDKILISDTYDGTESDNMGTLSSMATGKLVLTTTEWNALQGNNAISFKVKIQANEGVWVGEPLSRNDLGVFYSIFDSGGVFEGEKSNITEINFIRMSEEMMNTHGNAVDLTASGGQGVVKAWIDDTTLYIASPGETYFPVNSTALLAGYSNVTRINFNNINTSLVTNMNSMFASDSLLNNLDLSNFNTSIVENMAAMFGGCSNLTNINLHNLGSSYLTNITGMFSNCTNITNINMSGFNFGTANLSAFLANCAPNLEIIDLSDVTFSTTDITAMFQNKSHLRTIYVSNTWDVSGITSSNGLFSGCTSLVGGNGTRYIDKANAAQSGDTSYHDKTYAVIDDATHEGYLTLKNS